MREGEAEGAEKDRFSVVTDILSDVEEVQQEEEVGVRRREQLPHRRYRHILPRKTRYSLITGEHIDDEAKAAPPPLCVIQFCVSHSKTCDKAEEECQAAMSSSSAAVVSTAARETPGGVTAVKNRMSSGGGGGDIVTVTTVSKAIRPWDIATVVNPNSSEKRWVLFAMK